jgi:hypothetical protein
MSAKLFERLPGDGRRGQSFAFLSNRYQLLFAMKRDSSGARTAFGFSNGPVDFSGIEPDPMWARLAAATERFPLLAEELRSLATDYEKLSDATEALLAKISRMRHERK